MDLFAGSGALGLECLSRGAAFCLFVDNDAEARAVIATNLRSLGLTERARIIAGDAARLAGRPADESCFELAFLDPPYDRGFVEPTLSGLATGDWLDAGALIAVEQGVEDQMPRTDGFTLVDQRVWGRARVSFLTAGRTGARCRPA